MGIFKKVADVSKKAKNAVINATTEEVVVEDSNSQDSNNKKRKLKGWVKTTGKVAAAALAIVAAKKVTTSSSRNLEAATILQEPMKDASHTAPNTSSSKKSSILHRIFQSTWKTHPLTTSSRLRHALKASWLAKEQKDEDCMKSCHVLRTWFLKNPSSPCVSSPLSETNSSMKGQTLLRLKPNMSTSARAKGYCRT